MTHPDKQAALLGMCACSGPKPGYEFCPCRTEKMLALYLAQAAELERVRERMAYAAGKPYQECIHVLRDTLKKAE